jgi:hypothetical protein
MIGNPVWMHTPADTVFIRQQQRTRRTSVVTKYSGPSPSPPLHLEQLKASCLEAASLFNCTMISLFVVLFCSASAFPSSSAYQCPGPNNFASIPQEPLCPGICCQRSESDPTPSPSHLLTGPTCQIQADWFMSSNGTWVWPFPTFCFTYYFFEEDIMGGDTSKPAVSKTDTEVLTMRPNWETHANEEKNSGFFYSLLNVHISCALGTILFALSCMICVLLCYLGYRRFCHPKKKATTAPLPPPPPTCVTCLSCPPTS